MEHRWNVPLFIIVIREGTLSDALNLLESHILRKVMESRCEGFERQIEHWFKFTRYSHPTPII